MGSQELAEKSMVAHVVEVKQRGLIESRDVDLDLDLYVDSK